MNPEDNNNPLATGDSAPTSTPTPTPAEPTVTSEPTAPAEPAAPATPSVQPFGVVDSIPEEQPAEQPAANPTATTPSNAQFLSGDIANKDESEDSDADDEEKPKVVITPAAPVPGSIGSAISGPAVAGQSTAAAPATAPAEPTAPAASTNSAAPTIAPDITALADAETPAPAPTPMPMNNNPKRIPTRTIILAAIAAVIVIAGIIVFILISQSQKKETATPAPQQQPETPAVEEEPEETALVCSATVDDAKALAEVSEGLTNYTSVITANYLDDEFVGISSEDRFTFTDAELAQQYLTIARADYTANFSSLGLEADPFTSSFNLSDAVSIVTHTAESKDIKVENMAIFGLQANENNEVDTTPDSLQKLYKELNYICIIGNPAEIEE